MPGPPPSHRPRFPDEFLAEALGRARRRTAPAHLRQRPRLALLLHDRPLLSNVDAGARVELHPNSARLWRRRWAKGPFAFADQPGRGRRPTFSPARPGHGCGPRL